MMNAVKFENSLEYKNELDLSDLNEFNYESTIKEETDYDEKEPLVYLPLPTSAYIPMQVDPLKDEPLDLFIKTESDNQEDNYSVEYTIEEHNTESSLKSSNLEESLNCMKNETYRETKQDQSPLSQLSVIDGYTDSDSKGEPRYNINNIRKKKKRKVQRKNIHQNNFTTCNINPTDKNNLPDQHHCKIAVQENVNCIENYQQKCLKCKGIFFNKNDFNNHIDEFDMCKFLNCKICGMVYADTDRLQIHMKRKHDILEKDFKYKCAYCDLEYDKHISLYKHIARKHSPITVGIDNLKRNISYNGMKSIICSKCKGQFDSELLYKNHLDDNRMCKLLNCNICGMIYTNISNLHIHMKRKHNIIEGDFKFCCQYCGLEFMKKTTLLSHINVIHMSRPNKPAFYKCITCNAEFNLRNSLQKHIKRKHYLNSNSKELHICQFCGEMCEDFKKLSAHLNELHSSNLNELDIVNATTKPSISVDSCEDHNDLLLKTPTFQKQEPRILNSNNLKFKCRACSHECKDLKALRSHVRRYHCLLKIPKKNHALEKFTCEYCGVSMSSRSLNKHILRKHAEENESENLTSTYNRRHKCMYCDYRSDAKGNIKIHERIHTKEKPYICGIENCQHRAAHSTSIKLHRLTHDPKKNMLHCDHCNFKTINKYFFKMHQKEHQSGEKRTYICDLCPYRSIFLNNFHQHKLKHNEHRNFKCNNCFFSTKYIGSLRKHEKKKHGCNTCIEPVAEVSQITNKDPNWQDWTVNQNISHL